MGRKGMKGFLKGVAPTPDAPETEETKGKAAPAAASEASGSSAAPKAKKSSSKASKASAFLVSPPAGAVDPPSDDDADEGRSGGESRSQMLQRHKKELMAHKKAMSRMAKNKKDEVAKLTAELEARHGQELAALEEAESAASKPAPVAETTEKLADLSTSEQPSGKLRLTKAQKRRQKRAQEDAERDARIAEELAAAGPSAGQLEEGHLRQLLVPQQLQIREIRADGHCLYRAIEDQLQQQHKADDEDATTPPDYLRLRRLAAEHIRQHADDYAPFLAEEDEGAEEDGGDLEARLEAHCRRVEETAAWGGQMELRALAAALQRHIRVYAVGMPAVDMGEEHVGPGKGPLQVCYLRHAFGLGEHYNSVEPMADDSSEEEEEEEEKRKKEEGSEEEESDDE